MIPTEYLIGIVVAAVLLGFLSGALAVSAYVDIKYDCYVKRRRDGQEH
jgi:hypothetical protein